MKKLGLLNFIILQWFFIRLARIYETQPYTEDELYSIGWKLLYFIIPLTGWWSDFKYIGKIK